MTKAVQVFANDNYTILVILEDGRSVEFDLNYINQESGPVVDPLKVLSEFKKVFIRNGIVTWPTGYDIDPYYLLEQGILKSKSA